MHAFKKGNKELVTTAEKIAEKAMADEVRKTFPGHAIVGEEHVLVARTQVLREPSVVGARIGAVCPQQVGDCLGLAGIAGGGVAAAGLGLVTRDLRAERHE